MLYFTYNQPEIHKKIWQSRIVSASSVKDFYSLSDWLTLVFNLRKTSSEFKMQQLNFKKKRIPTVQVWKLLNSIIKKHNG